LEAGPDPSAPRVVRRAVLRFTAWTLVALLVLALATVIAAQRIAREEALRDARVRATALTRVVSGLVTGPVRAGDSAALTEVSRAMQPRLGRGAVVHAKFWDPDGTVLWSDEPELIRRRFDLDEEITALFGTHDSRAEVSQLERDENVRERGDEQLLEVYVGSSGADGKPLVFEAYLSTSGMKRDERAIISGILPLALGGLLLFGVAVLPMALALARRVERAQQERSTLLRHALLASDLERRRIAQDLHDGVIQDLAGLGYAMPIVAAHLSSGPEAADARDAVQHVSTCLSRDVAALRSMLTDIYPPDLEGEGLLAAVEELAQRAEDAGVLVSVHVTPGFSAPLDAARLAYRVVREGLRNVLRHAHADTAEVQLSRLTDSVVVRVVDDGRGPGPDPAATPGHLGLRLLEDTVRDLGGRLDLSAGAAGGAILEAVFPIDLTVR
jgi:signal transduction histidine kinase